MATTAAAVAAKARQDVMSHFLSRHAVTEASAVPYAPGRRIRERQFEKLRELGVILTASNGGHYVDVAAWDNYRRRVRKRVIGGVAIGAMLGALAAILA